MLSLAAVFARHAAAIFDGAAIDAAYEITPLIIFASPDGYYRQRLLRHYAIAPLMPPPLRAADY